MSLYFFIGSNTHESVAENETERTQKDGTGDHSGTATLDENKTIHTLVNGRRFEDRAGKKNDSVVAAVENRVLETI